MSQKIKTILAYLVVAVMALSAVPAIAAYTQPVFLSTVGLLASVNNLADVASTSTARDNIGLGASSTPTFTGVITTGNVTSTSFIGSGASLTGIDHVNLANKGTNTHAQIDTHIGASNPHTGSAPTASPNFSGMPMFPSAGLGLTDSNFDQYLILRTGENITSSPKTLDIRVSNANRTLTMTADATISGTNSGDGATQAVDGTPDTDHTANGHTTNAFSSGYTSTIMDLVTMSSNGKWLPTDANVVASSTSMLGMALEAKTDTQAMSIALPGTFVRDDTWNWTPGQTLYVSETSAQITATQPTTADVIIRVVGFAVTADVIYFNPSADYITHT